jgi:ABC-type phosphate transport system ATPase subunit
LDNSAGGHEAAAPNGKQPLGQPLGDTPPSAMHHAKAAKASMAIEVRGMNLWYGNFQALHDVDLDIKSGIVTSMIGPSGCGKSTLLRSCNRINERLDYVRTTGTIKVLGEDIYADDASRIQVRRHVGMVFQRPNPLPLSIRDNVLFGHRLHAGARRHRRTSSAAGAAVGARQRPAQQEGDHAVA